MSAAFMTKESSSEPQPAGIEAGVQPEAAGPAIVTVGDPIPDGDVFDAFIEQENLSSGADRARTALVEKPAPPPRIVLMNFNRLTYDAQQQLLGKC